MGVRPLRSGSAKLTRPSPPKVVPSKLKSAWFWLIGRSWPLHKAQPFGANPKLMRRISERKGSATDQPLWAHRGRCCGRVRGRRLVARPIGLVLHVLDAVLGEGRETGVAPVEVVL